MLCRDMLKLVIVASFVSELKNNFNCYPIQKRFLLQKVSTNQKFLEYRDQFSKADKTYYLSLIDFSKLLVYSRSQNVVVNPNIEKFFYLMATRKKCSMTGFNSDKTFSAKFKKIVELEVFVRSRFLPTEKNDKTTKADIDKAVLASQNLLKSIARQIEEEVYW